MAPSGTTWTAEHITGWRNIPVQIQKADWWYADALQLLLYIYITRIYCCTYNTLTQQWVYRVRASRHTRIVYTHMFLFFSALASSSCVTDGLQSMPYASCAVTGSFGTTCCLVRKQQQQYIVNPFCFEFRWVDINNVPVVLFDSISQLWRLHERQAL
jgi:hypothetical protein